MLWSDTLIRSGLISKLTCLWKIIIIIIIATNLSILRWTCELTVFNVLINKTERTKAQHSNTCSQNKLLKQELLLEPVFFIQAVFFVRLGHRRSLLSGLQYFELLFCIKIWIWWFEMSSYLESTLFFCRKKPVQLLGKSITTRPGVLIQQLLGWQQLLQLLRKSNVYFLVQK